MSDQDLFDRLCEDLGSPEEAAELLPIIQKLKKQRAPAPTTQETRLISAPLLPLLEARTQKSPTHFARGWMVLRGQLRVVRHEIWAASLIVMGIGFLITLSSSFSATAQTTLPFVLMAPIAAAAGIAFLYGPEVDPALEVELSLPVSQLQILLARLALVFGFNLVLGLAGSAVLDLHQGFGPFWQLVSTWLAPMAFLSALAFLLITWTLDPNLSLTVSLGLWVIHYFTRFILNIHRPLPFPDLTAASARPWLWLLAALLSAAAIWLAGREEHWLKTRS